MNSKSMAGWIGFAGMVMVIIGGINFFQGLIAIFEDEYYVVTRSGYLVFDLTAWGWIMLIWGILLVLIGLALMSGADWARWASIVVVSVNVFAQLGFLGNSNYPLWALTALTLEHHRALRTDRTMEREQHECAYARLTWRHERRAGAPIKGRPLRLGRKPLSGFAPPWTRE